MTTTVEQPPEAERSEAEAEAGAGADETAPETMPETNVDPEKGNGMGASPSESSEAVATPEKEQEKVETEQKRSKGKIALLMAALCVRTTYDSLHVWEYGSADIMLFRWPFSLLRLIRSVSIMYLHSNNILIHCLDNHYNRSPYNICVFPLIERGLYLDWICLPARRSRFNANMG